ncbi:MAG: TonB-dependent receptor [Nitrospirae bacterium]|nr:TonB-dependent receptor [Nitrospirota bacterium]
MSEPTRNSAASAALAAVVGVLIILCVAASEARASQRDLTQISIEELLDVEVYSASKTVQKTTKAPASVTIVTASDIRKFGYRTLADMLRSVRGFYITYDRTYHYVGVRGFARPGDYNTRILLLLDGVRLNENVFDQAFIGNDFPVDIDLIDRVEVIRGPGSSLYGSNAFFAVINVITRRAKDFGGVEVSGEAGSHETYRARLSYGDHFANNAEAVFSGSHFDSRGNRRLYFSEFDEPGQNNGIAEGLDSEKTARAFAKLSFSGFTLLAVYSRWQKETPTAAWGAVFNKEILSMEEHALLDLKYETTLAGDLSLMWRVNYNQHPYHSHTPYDYAEPGGPPLLVTNNDLSRSRWWGTELQLNRRLFGRHDIVAGAEYRDNIQQDMKNYDIEVYTLSRSNSRIWAVYMQDQFNILDNLVLNAGIRYDHYSTVGSTANPRIALIYSPFGQTTFKLLYGTAFRSPDAYELHYEAMGYRINPSLKPEKIRTYELVWEQQIGDSVRGTAAVFSNKIEDLITLTTDPDDFLVFRNVATVEAEGIELGLEGKWESGLTGRISYTFQETKDRDTGNILTNSPRHLAKINVSIPLLREKIFLGLEEQYAGKRKTLRGLDAKASYVTNATLFSQRLVHNLEASVSVYNLFDFRYGDPGSEEHVQDIIQQDGRSFRFKATYRF